MVFGLLIVRASSAAAGAGVSALVLRPIRIHRRSRRNTTKRTEDGPYCLIVSPPAPPNLPPLYFVGKIKFCGARARNARFLFLSSLFVFRYLVNIRPSTVNLCQGCPFVRLDKTG